MCSKCGTDYHKSICNCKRNTERQEFKVGDEWLTRDYRTARIIAIIKSSAPIIAVVSDSNGYDILVSLNSNGRIYNTTEDVCDLIVPKPKPKIAWLTIADGKPYGTWTDIRHVRAGGYTEIYRIEYVPGEIPKCFKED